MGQHLLKMLHLLHLHFTFTFTSKHNIWPYNSTLCSGGQCPNDPVSHQKYLTVKLYQVIFMLKVESK